MLRAARARFLLTGALVLSVAALIAILALIPAYLSVALPRMSLADAIQTDDKERSQEESDREIGSKTRALLATLAPFSEERPRVYSLIARAYALRPSGITIERMTYAAGTRGEITIVGTALSREHVSTYRAALAAESAFTSVSVPVAALVGASLGRFTVTLSGEF